MRALKLLALSLVLAAPGVTVAESEGESDWYFHVDLDRMRSEAAGRVLYTWLQDEVLDEIEEDAGIDIDRELDTVTALSVRDAGTIVVMEGSFSQETKDRIMALLAVDGDIRPLTSSGRSYYRFGDDVSLQKAAAREAGAKFELEFEDGAWISLDVAKKILITSTEQQMKLLLARDGVAPGAGGNGGALLVLSAEKTLIQASMDGTMLNGDEGSGWESNILRNAEQVAFLLAAKAGKIVVEARLVTEDEAVAESLASVARGVVSLVSFDDSMSPEVVSMLSSMQIEADDNTLSLSLAMGPDLVVQTLGE